MSWFGKNKCKKTATKIHKESLKDIKQKKIEEMLLSMSLESYKSKNFTVSFLRDYDREDMEFNPNLFHFRKGHKSDYRKEILKHLKDKPLVVINPNQNISWDWGVGAHKKGGLNFDLYTKNEEGHILQYSYDNVEYYRYSSDVKDSFEMYLSVYDGNYSRWNVSPEEALERNWCNSIPPIKINRMKKLEKLIQLMVDEQTIDKEARNIKRMDKFLSLMPKKSKRIKVLKELLEE